MAKSEGNVQKGKLELMLDEFSEVHGAVLLGMHKELQTLKADVDKRVETKIGAILEQTLSADAQLVARISEAEKAATSLEGKATNAHQSLCDEGERFLKLISEKIAQFEKARAKAWSEIETSQRDQRRLANEIEQRRTDFNREVSAAKDEMATMLKEHDKRIAAAVKFADHLSRECASSLKAANERYELLQAREFKLQQRTRQIVIAAAVFVLATLGLWIWLLQTH